MKLLPLFRATLMAVFVSLAPAYGAAFKFSYEFGAGDFVHGTFTGTQNGEYVENIADLVMWIGGEQVQGTLYSAAYDSSTAGWVSGGLISFNANLNNFLFANDDIANGGYGFDSFFWMVNATARADLDGVALAESYPAGVFATDQPYDPARWSLIDLSNGVPVPDSGSALLLSLLTFSALLGWRRLRAP